MKKVKRRRYDIRRIRPTMSYSVQEIAETFDIHKSAVLNWIKQGLKIIDHHKPYLVYGETLVHFLRDRKDKKLQVCKPDEFYCCKCRKPQRSQENLVTIEIISPHRIKIMGQCWICQTKLFRAASTKNLAYFQKIFSVSSLAEEHIYDCLNVSVDSEIFEKGNT
jgi:hypothetical protein